MCVTASAQRATLSGLSACGMGSVRRFQHGNAGTWPTPCGRDAQPASPTSRRAPNDVRSCRAGVPGGPGVDARSRHRFADSPDEVCRTYPMPHVRKLALHVFHRGADSRQVLEPNEPGPPTRSASSCCTCSGRCDARSGAEARDGERASGIVRSDAFAQRVRSSFTTPVRRSPGSGRASRGRSPPTGSFTTPVRRSPGSRSTASHCPRSDDAAERERSSTAARGPAQVADRRSAGSPRTAALARLPAHPVEDAGRTRMQGCGRAHPLCASSHQCGMTSAEATQENRSPTGTFGRRAGAPAVKYVKFRPTHPVFS